VVIARPDRALPSEKGPPVPTGQEAGWAPELVRRGSNLNVSRVRTVNYFVKPAFAGIVSSLHRFWPMKRGN